MFLCCCPPQTELLFGREVQPPAQKTFDAEGTCSEEILLASERGDQKSVFLGTPISERYHKGRMQKAIIRTQESVGSGGGSDSELSHVRSRPTNHGRGSQVGETLRSLVRESER
jgi:hypothetical protein